MNITFVLSAYPPKICGIGDYTNTLKETLSKTTNTNVISGLNWNIEPIKLYRKIASTNPDIIHFQYPTTGLMTHALLPLCKKKYNVVITCHEYSECVILRKLSMCIFSITDQLIWTNQNDYSSFTKIYPWTKKRSHIIPIGSTVPYCTPINLRTKTNTIAYFGIIRQGKGLENFFELAKLAATKNLPYRFLVIGGTLDLYQTFYDEARQQYNLQNMDWIVNRPVTEVADLLSKAKYAYLPFPDGASERRTSLLAALGNGCTTITTNGPYITKRLKETVKLAKNPGEALAIIKKIDSNYHSNNLCEKARSYAMKFDWDTIAKQHLDVYNNLLKNNK